VGQTGPDAFSIVVQPVDGGSRRVLVTAGRLGFPLPSGHLAYLRGTDLMAVRFDETTQAVSGEPVVIASDIAAQIAVSPTGTFVHMPPAGLATRTAVWVDRRGSEEPIGLPPQPMNLLRLSPDGSRLTFSSGTEIRVWTFAKATMTRLREDEGGQWDAAWMPDGNRLLFSAGRVVASNRILMKAADGSGPTTTVIPSAMGFPNDVSTDSKLLLYHRGVGELMLYPLDGSAPPRQIVKGRSLNGVFSPDGRWIAYQSTESNRMEIFVRAFPDLDAGRWQVSTGGGRYPVWSPDGRELFFISDSGHLTGGHGRLEQGVCNGRCHPAVPNRRVRGDQQLPPVRHRA
jgi:eukaryotic-like serine/threonine-protein kinase